VSALADAAVDLAFRGWFVFPLRARSKGAGRELSVVIDNEGEP
jgi:hypothetical protein